MSTLSEKDTHRLREAVVATKSSPNSFVRELPMHMSALEKAGHVQRGPDNLKEGAKFAYRATDQGIAHVDGLDAPGGAAPQSTDAASGVSTTAVKPRASRAPLVSAGEIKLESGIPLPEKPARATGGTGRQGRGEVYPFGSMEVGYSFFLPATEARPNVARSLTSAIVSATKRHAPKQFEVRNVTEGGVDGARVWRLDDMDADTLAEFKAKVPKARAKKPEAPTKPPVGTDAAPAGETASPWATAS